MKIYTVVITNSFEFVGNFSSNEKAAEYISAHPYQGVYSVVINRMDDRKAK